MRVSRQKSHASNRVPARFRPGNNVLGGAIPHEDGNHLVWILALAFLLLLLLVLLHASADVAEGVPIKQNPVPEAARSATQILATPHVETLVQRKRANESAGETETRAALQRIFGKTFSKVRPPFLINPETKRRLELDCFNADLRLGVEFNGAQHYIFPNAFHKTMQEFEAQQRRDRYKEALCQEANVRLVVVPYTVPLEAIEAFLRRLLVA